MCLYFPTSLPLFLSQVSFKISLSIDITKVFFDMDLDWKTTISRDFIGNIIDDFKKVLRSLARLFRAENVYLVCAVFPSDINWIWNCILFFYSRSSQNYTGLDNRIRDFPRRRRDGKFAWWRANHDGEPEFHLTKTSARIVRPVLPVGQPVDMYSLTGNNRGIFQRALFTREKKEMHEVVPT